MINFNRLSLSFSRHLIEMGTTILIGRSLLILLMLHLGILKRESQSVSRNLMLLSRLSIEIVMGKLISLNCLLFSKKWRVIDFYCFIFFESTVFLKPIRARQTIQKDLKAFKNSASPFNNCFDVHL